MFKGGLLTYKTPPLIPGQKYLGKTLVNDGTGLMVTVKVNNAPVQLPVIGVIIYVAVCTVLVELVKVPDINDPVPDCPPDTPPVTVGKPQLYVVPTGAIPFIPSTGVTENEMPEQVVVVIELILA